MNIVYRCLLVSAFRESFHRGGWADGLTRSHVFDSIFWVDSDDDNHSRLLCTISGRFRARLRPASISTARLYGGGARSAI